MGSTGVTPLREPAGAADPRAPLLEIRDIALRFGGIDLFGGSFSFINKAQFVALLQNIGANAVGYAFKLALQSISPDIDKLLTELQDQINKINTMNINSCEAAQSLVNGIWGQFDNSIMSGCENIAQYLGSAADRADARGVPRRALVMDPGLGFAKNARHRTAKRVRVMTAACGERPCRCRAR